MQQAEAFFAALAESAPVVVQPIDRRTGAAPDHPNPIYVGCSPPEATAPGALILDNKQAGVSSVTRLVHARLPELWAQAGLPPWPTHGTPPAQMLQRHVLVVEDASPDSLFAVLVLLAYAAGLSAEDIPERWLAAIDAWERTGNAEQPEASWPALASALVHAALTPPRANWQQAWVQGLRFAAGVVLADRQRSAEAKFDPAHLPPLPDLPGWQAAQAVLRQERQIYEEWLEHATLLQLSVPTTSGGRLLVDGLLVVEDRLAGLAKVLYRNDRARSPLREGFAFAVQYRPSERQAANGYDVTITTDPRAGLVLTDLWRRLERLEQAAWQQAGVDRPTAAPRKLALVTTPYTQPWYLNDDGSLIAAPRGIPGPAVGTRLSWPQIREAVWDEFNPLKQLSLCNPGVAEPVALTALTPQHTPFNHGKTLLMAEWPRQHEQAATTMPRAITTRAPVIERILAGLLYRRAGAGAMALDTLPEHCRVLHLSGGLAVLTETGLFVLDDWHNERLNLPAIRMVFDRIARLDYDLRQLESGPATALTEAVAALRRRPNAARQQKAVRLCAVEVGLQTANLRHARGQPAADPDVRKLARAIEDEWGIGERLETLAAQVDGIDSALARLSEVSQQRAITLVTMWGFLGFASMDFVQALSTVVQNQWSKAAILSTTAAATALLGGLLWLLTQKPRR
jgi:hypothetical protein